MIRRLSGIWGCRRDYWIALGLVLMTTIAFCDVLRFSFLQYDDQFYVTGNWHVRDGVSLQGVAWALTSTLLDWLPLTRLSHMVDCQIFGMDPMGHHAVNLLFHMLNTLLLFGAWKTMTGASGQSALVAALFAVHPLHVESVAWIAERKDVLCGFFWMGTLLAYVRYVRATCARGSYGLVVMSFACALMSKPMAITLPFVLLALDYWPLARFPSKGYRALLWEKLPLMILSALICPITLLAQRSDNAVVSVADISWSVRIANALVAYGTYLVKTFWPFPLVVFYPHSEGLISRWQIFGAALVLTVISAAALRQRKERPYWIVGWTWYLVTLLPVIGLIQVGAQAMADRYTYLPLIGIFVVLVWGAKDLARRFSISSKILGGTAIVVLALLVTCSRVQASHWNSTIDLFTHAVRHTSGNWLAHRILGSAWLLEGKPEKAIEQFHEELKIRPDSVQAYLRLGNVYEKRGQDDLAAREYALALKIQPDFVPALNNLGYILERQGKKQQAFLLYTDALRADPMDAHAHSNLGNILSDQGKITEAIEHYRKSIKSNPDLADAHYNLAILLSRRGDVGPAIGHYLAAEKINPKDPDVHNNLGLVLLQCGKLSQAVAQFHKALEIDPRHAQARQNLQNIRVHGKTAGGQR